jgi:hypothetical protein
VIYLSEGDLEMVDECVQGCIVFLGCGGQGASGKIAQVGLGNKCQGITMLLKRWYPAAQADETPAAAACGRINSP